jgi:ABC-2 type transport system ATP-binding protein
MIEYRNVVKRYGGAEAISNFSLTIAAGEFFGLLGPNGAGKTTLLRMTTTLTPPTSGEIFIDGELIRRNQAAIKRKLGIVPQYSNLEIDVSAWENLEYHGRLYGLPRLQRRRRTEELLEFTGLTARRNDTARTFSGGMRRRLMIAKSLMHEPEILLLDEPTVGLDASARRNIWDLLRHLNSKGLTIFLTTHYLEEAETLCRRVGMIDSGRLRETGSPEELVKNTGNYVLEYFENGKTSQVFFETEEAAFASLKQQPDHTGADQPGREVKIRRVNLEDAFILLTNKRLEQ